MRSRRASATVTRVTVVVRAGQEFLHGELETQPMGNVIQMQPTRLGDEGFGWLVGCSIEDLSFAEPSSWWFRLSSGGQISTHGGVWRILSAEKMVSCSEDHGQWFGLPAPFDAIDVALAALRDASVIEARVREGAPDLEVRLSHGLTLEVLALSTGHECWQACDPSGRCVVVHGSRHASTWQEDPAR